MTEKSDLVRGESRIIGGVCSALSKRYNVQTWVLRLIFVITSLFFGLSILIYMTFWIAIPIQNKAHIIAKKRKYLLQTLGFIVGGLAGWFLGYRYGLQSIGDDKSIFIFVFIFAAIGFVIGIIIGFAIVRMLYEKYSLTKMSK